MGLDVHAFAKLKKVDAVYDVYGEPIHPVSRRKIKGDYIQVQVNDDFPGRAEPFKHGEIYRYDHELTREQHIRIGYGGYSYWRNHLAKMAGYPEIEYTSHYGGVEKSYAASAWASEWGEKPHQGPFFELICYADDNGDIGTFACQRLLKDFEKFANDAKKMRMEHRTDEYFGEIYEKFHCAFAMGAQDGLVHFG